MWPSQFNTNQTGRQALVWPLKFSRFLVSMILYLWFSLFFVRACSLHQCYKRNDSTDSGWIRKIPSHFALNEINPTRNCFSAHSLRITFHSVQFSIYYGFHLRFSRSNLTSVIFGFDAKFVLKMKFLIHDGRKRKIDKSISFGRGELQSSHQVKNRGKGNRMAVNNTVTLCKLRGEFLCQSKHKRKVICG